MLTMLKKLISALNSSQYSWQLSLAIALGMVPGLTPFASPHNFLFVLLAFFLNVHLGLFFVSMAVFAAIAWVADPAMEALGHMLLTLPALEGFWTALYNNPWALLTGFNNTLLLGSLVLGLLLMGPVYLLAERFVWIYRGPISRVTGKLPLIRKLLAFDEEKAAKAKRPARVRWIGLGTFAGLTGGALLFGVVFLDTILKGQLEKQLSRSAGAEASVATLTTRLSPLSLEISGIELPDREDLQTNAVEVDRIAFDLDLSRLFHKKILINELAAEGVRLGVARTHPARPLPIEPVALEPAEPAEPTLSQRAALELGERLPEPRELVSQATLTTHSEGARIQEELEAIKAKWEQIAAHEFGADAFADLNARFNDLQQRAKAMGSPEEVREIAREARSLEADAQARVAAYRQRISEFQDDRRRSDQLLDELRKLPGADYEALRAKYSLDADGAFNLAGTLLGDDVRNYLLLAREWYEKVMPFARTAREFNQKRRGPQLESPPRGEGRTIRFREFTPRPELLLARAAFDVTTQNGSQLTGQLTGATSDQRITGEPMRLGLRSTRPVGYEELAFSWVGDSRTDERLDALNFTLAGYEREGTRADRLQMAPGRLAVQLDVDLHDARRLEGGGKLIFAPAALSLERPRGELEEVIARTLSGVERFDVDLTVGGRIGSPSVRLSTDLDRQLNQHFRAELGAQLKAFEASLQRELDGAVRDQLARAGLTGDAIGSMGEVMAGDLKAVDAIAASTGQELSEEALRAKLDTRLAAEQQRLTREAEERAEQEKRQAEEAARARQEEERRRLEQEMRDRLRNLR